jgi:hypothetical protein
MKYNLRIIGDVHGHSDSYLRLILKAEHTIQVGDLGFDYSFLSGVDARQHWIVAGNHDNYDDMVNWSHFLGDYGVHSVPGFGDIFFVRGGISIDRHLRTEGVSWWRDEELSMKRCYEALAEYTRIKPHFVVSHECPRTIVPHVMMSPNIIPSKTKQLLEQMFATHQPTRWVFGHYHRSFKKTVDGTCFQCLDELECLDI